VAIKTIRDELATDRRAIRSFEQEAIAAARLSTQNPHVLSVLDLGRLEDWYYQVLEWIPPAIGGRPDISSLTGACTVVRARQIMMHISDAVSTAHARGIVHSDIAPWNVLYRADIDRYLLTDFGLARVVEKDLLSIPSRSLLVGGRRPFLPAYARDSFDVSKATDVYALAITFWTLLSGERNMALGEEIPGVIPVVAEQRDAPIQARQLLTRFVECHDPTDTVADFKARVEEIPVR